MGSLFFYIYFYSLYLLQISGHKNEGPQTGPSFLCPATAGFLRCSCAVPYFMGVRRFFKVYFSVFYRNLGTLALFGGYGIIKKPKAEGQDSPKKQQRGCAGRVLQKDGVGVLEC